MKAILLVRVSTKAQDFDEQEREIYNMAIKDGYKPEDIIPICEKESGIKLSEEERAGLNRMKELVESDPTINCVYCWEVSRIARRKKINFSVLDYLLSHKVQLIVKNPSIKLIKENGEIDEGAEIIFTLFSQMAESEMRTKLARWKRTKDAKKKQGYYIGGYVTYGYTRDTNNKLIINESEADVVRTIFNMYLSGKYSTRSIAKEMIEKGIFKGSLVNISRWVNNILHNTDYCGKGRNDVLYPAIVTEDMIEKCKAIAQVNIIKPKTLFSSYYFAKGILRCPICGTMLIARKGKCIYSCQQCDKINININIVDSVLWRTSIGLYASKMLHSTSNDRIDIQKQLMDLETKINTAINNIKNIESRIEDIETKAYVDLTMDVAKADKFIAGLNEKIKVEQKNITYWSNSRFEKEQILIGMDNNKPVNIDTIAFIKDDKERYNIIHSVIDCAFIDKIDLYNYIISVYPTYWNKPIKYKVNTRNHKIYSDITEELSEFERGVYYREINSVKVAPKVEDLSDWFELRFDRTKKASPN